MGFRETLRHLFVARANSVIAAPAPQLEKDSRHRPSVQSGESEQPPKTSQPASPVFLTPQSLLSFPVASFVINMLWQAAALVNKDFAKLTIVPIVSALIVGALIYVISYDAGMSRRHKIVGFFVAAFNSIWLGLNALGISIGKPPA